MSNAQTQADKDLQIQQIIGKLILVRLDIGAYHGTSRSPFEAAGFQEDLYTPGSMRLMDRKHLKCFTTLRAAANRYCVTEGTRFLGGYAIPEEKIKGLHKLLKETRDEFIQKKDAFVASLPVIVEEWAKVWEEKGEPEKAAEIRAKKPDPEYVKKALHFRVATVRVTAETVEDGINDGMENEVGSLAWNIACEIAQDVKDTWKPVSLRGTATQRIRTGLLKRIADKADGLAFISPKVGRIRDLINGVADALPQVGSIEGKDFLMLQGLVSLLENPSKLLSDLPLKVSIDEEGEQPREIEVAAKSDAPASAEVKDEQPAYAW